MTRNGQIRFDEVATKIAVEQLLDDLGWGALLITTGTFWLLPAGYVPRGGWLIAVGLILLAFNAARHILRIEMNGFALAAGFMAVITGVGCYLSMRLPFFPIALIVAGASWLLVSSTTDGSIASRPACRHCCE